MSKYPHHIVTFKGFYGAEMSVFGYELIIVWMDDPLQKKSIGTESILHNYSLQNEIVPVRVHVFERH